METAEKVLVVRHDLILPLIEKPFGTQNLDTIIKTIVTHHEFMDRPQAEIEPQYKQIIPYVICRYDGLYYMTQRTKMQGEQRLHGKFSLGVGGHINPSDAGEPNILDSGMRRELREEVMMVPKDISPIGTIYVDSTDVGRVHVGIAYLLDAAHPRFEVREPEQHAQAKWATPTDIAVVYDRLEDWSKIIFDYFIRGGSKLSTQAS